MLTTTRTVQFEFRNIKRKDLLPLAVFVYWPPVPKVDFPCAKCQTVYRVTKADARRVARILGYVAQGNECACDCQGSVIE